MTGHGFAVTGDPADLPPGAKMIELNIGETVDKVARALYEQIRATDSPEFDQIHAMEKHNLRELGVTAVMALVEDGWHSQEMHDQIKAAMAEDNTRRTGMEPN